MDQGTLWYLIIGTIFTMIGIFHYFLKRMPLTTAMVYLPIGFALSPYGFDLINFNLHGDAHFLERVSEIVVVISLFTAGLKLRSPLKSPDWQPAFHLATLSMSITVISIAAFAVFALNFSWGAAILLGAILAPTDPVLASDVQVRGPTDRDPLRFGLTGEAGLNDGTAFPFVMLGLGLLGVHDIGVVGSKWLFADVFWATTSGLLIGWIMGTWVARLILYIRARNRESTILDDFLTIGLICLSYGVALSAHAYGFLAVFTAGLALRRIERLHSSKRLEAEPKIEVGPESNIPPAQVAKGVLTFNEQLERLGEIATVVIVGAMLEFRFFQSWDLILLPVLFLIIRPLSVAIGLFGLNVPSSQRNFMSWFGIRGIGSIYYLSYAVAKGIPPEQAQRITSLVLATVSISILVHGLSVTPLMDFYQRQIDRYNRNRFSRKAQLT